MSGRRRSELPFISIVTDVREGNLRNRVNEAKTTCSVMKHNM